MLHVSSQYGLIELGFARLRFPVKNVLFMLYLAGLMVPFQVIVVPEAHSGATAWARRPAWP
jgi:hypothetical protein